MAVVAVTCFGYAQLDALKLVAGWLVAVAVLTRLLFALQAVAVLDGEFCVVAEPPAASAYGFAAALS